MELRIELLFESKIQKFLMTFAPLLPEKCTLMKCKVSYDIKISFLLC